MLTVYFSLHMVYCTIIHITFEGKLRVQILLVQMTEIYLKKFVLVQGCMYLYRA